MTLVYIRDSKSRGYIRLGIDCEGEVRSYTVSECEYRSLGSPASRDEISEDAFSAILTYDMKYRARLKALNILAYGDNSEKTLYMKLKRAGISSEIAEETVKEAVSRGYVDSERQIERLITNEVRLNLRGPMKIIPKLVSKGYSKGEIIRVMTRLADEGEIDFEDSKMQLIEKKLPEGASEEEKKKLLYKNGYKV